MGPTRAACQTPRTQTHTLPCSERYGQIPIRILDNSTRSGTWPEQFTGTQSQGTPEQTVCLALARPSRVSFRFFLSELLLGAGAVKETTGSFAVFVASERKARKLAAPAEVFA